jgi:pimeloyl-ACP methyl ester carboxylesterase
LTAANGLTFHVQELGSGPPAVLIHGLLLGNLASWYLTLAPALARSHRLLLYDLRGHGLSERPDRGYDLASMASDLEALSDAFDAKPLVLVGHSYGALIALRFALDRPERVHRLVLVEAPLPPSRVEQIQQFLQLDPSSMLASLPAPLREALVARARRRSRLIETLLYLGRETTLASDLAAEPDFSEAALARLTCPTLCVYGERSACRDVGTRLSAVVPAARLEILPGGHWLPFEAPGLLACCVLEFLNG